jgi:cytosine deaminase
MDLVIRNAKLRARKKLVDIAIESGRIVSITEKVRGRGVEEIDAQGRLILPSFSDMHMHLDAVLTLGDPRFNESGTLLEGIEIWRERKRKLTISEMKKRVERAIKWIVAHGTTRLRTHADVTEPTLSTVKGLLEIKREYSDMIDLQVTAFPQDGILTSPENLEQLEKALELGTDNVGLIPHLEYTREDGIRSIEIAFELAKKYDRDIDGHIDETDDEQSRFLEVLAAKTIRENYKSRVVAGHATAMHSYNNAYAFKLFGILKKAELTVVANPLTNICTQGRFDTYPKRRGLTRIKELLQYGINVALGHDCIMDPWYPLGKGDMLHALFMTVHVAQLVGAKELMDSFDLITVNAAKALRVLDDYGVEVGKKADLVILDAHNELEALRTLAPRLYVIKSGKILARTTPAETTIYCKRKEEKISFSTKP